MTGQSALPISAPAVLVEVVTFFGILEGFASAAIGGEEVEFFKLVVCTAAEFRGLDMVADANGLANLLARCFAKRCKCQSKVVNTIGSWKDEPIA